MKRVADVSQDVVIVAREVKGYCSAKIKVGDKIVVKGPNICLDETDVICGYALAGLFPVIFAVRLGVNLDEIGLTKRYWQCIDAGPPHTPGGTVLFEVIPLQKFNE